MNDITEEIQQFFDAVKSSFELNGPEFIGSVDFAQLSCEFLNDIIVDETSELFLLTLSIDNHVEESEKEMKPSDFAAGCIEHILKPFDQLSASESFPSYTRKTCAVQKLLHTLVETHRLGIEEKRYLLKETWRISLRAAWTIHRQIIIYRQ